MIIPSREETVYACALYQVPGFGAKTARMLYEQAGGGRVAYELHENELKELGVTRAKIDNLIRYRVSHDPVSDYNSMEKKGIYFVPYFDPGFPGKLVDIPDPPFGIYYSGKLPDQDRPSIAVIGARMCSEYGRFVAREFGKDLAVEGIQVISGMARGVDGISQKAALEAGGASYAVLGCGVDICYPEENGSLYRSLLTNGGVISEYNPGTLPQASYFPPRNRIISGLADAVLVVEARSRSGTLITVDMALEQGREVFAVPGRICDRLSDGCLTLIRQGATAVSSASEILEYLYGTTSCGTATPSGETADPDDAHFAKYSRTDNSDPLKRLILDHLDLNPISVSDLAGIICREGNDYPVTDIINSLMELCISGDATQIGGQFGRAR